VDRSVSPEAEGRSGRERALDIAELLREAQADCRASAEQVADARGRQLFDKIAGYLDVAIQALQAYQREQPTPRRHTLH